MTNKKFKMAAVSLALTACVAASPLAANAESSDSPSDAKHSASSQHEPEAPAEKPAEEPAVQETSSSEEAEEKFSEPEEQKPSVQPAETAEAPAVEETPVVLVLPEEQEQSEETEEEQPDDAEQTLDAEETENESEEEKQPAVLPAAGGIAAEDPYGISTMLPDDRSQFVINAGSAMIDGNDDVIYGTLDDAIKNAASGSTIKVTQDSTCSGIILDNKDLTIEGDTSTKDSKPKLTFTKEGIYLKNSKLSLKNLDAAITGVTSTPNHADGLTWMGICLNQKSDLTLDNTDLVMDSGDPDATKTDSGKDAIYMAGNAGNSLNITNDSHLTIRNYRNAIAWNGTKENPDSKYEINVTEKSSLTADGNGAGIVGLESLDVLVDDSTLTITNCTDRSGINGANVKIVNGSTANISNNHEGYGIHANDLLVEDSTLTANNNGYGGIRITGKGQFTNSTVTVTGTEDKGNASIEITIGKNEHKDQYLTGSLNVKNSTLNVSDNNATGIACRKRYGLSTSLTIDDASVVTIQNNHATPKNGFNTKGDIGGGLRIEEGSTAKLGRNTIINNNHADKAGDDLFILPGGTLTFSVRNATGDGHTLNDDGCGHTIDGWYTDADGRRWDFHGDQNYVEDILDGTITLPDGVALVENGDGTYSIIVSADAAEGLALKAAHAELPTPDPDDPDPTPTPDPDPSENDPDSPVLPEDPANPPVQDARPDEPVMPEEPELPPVQDARADEPAVQNIHALPQTGTSLFAALAMALSGIALMAAGAWASLTGKKARH